MQHLASENVNVRGGNSFKDAVRMEKRVRHRCESNCTDRSETFDTSDTFNAFDKSKTLDNSCTSLRPEEPRHLRGTLCNDPDDRSLR